MEPIEAMDDGLPVDEEPVEAEILDQGAFDLVDPEGPLMGQVQEVLEECFRDWPELDPHLLAVADMRLTFAAKPGSGGVSEVVDGDLAVTLADGLPLDNPFFESCVSLGLDGTSFQTSEPLIRRTEVELVLSNQGDDPGAQLQDLLADEEALAARGLSRERVEEALRKYREVQQELGMDGPAEDDGGPF